MSANQSLRPEANPNPAPQQQTEKKKRKKPGTPDPRAVVVSLSPQMLLAKGIYVCEVCDAGFQRDQNLQLHRRTHNLGGKLKKTGRRNVKKVYTCPEPACVHHDPTRALGDLSGIKKHYIRKHCQKKWKCEKCGKMYAFESDMKTHFGNCRSAEYTCECGGEFSSEDGYRAHQKRCYVALRKSLWPFLPTTGENSASRPGAASSDGSTARRDQNARPAPGSHVACFNNTTPDDPEFPRAVPAGPGKTVVSPSSLAVDPTNFPMANGFEGREQQIMVPTGNSPSFSLFHRPSQLQLPAQEKALHGPPPPPPSSLSGLPQNVNEEAGMGQSQVFGQVKPPGASHDPMMPGEGANDASSNVSLGLPALNAPHPSMAPSFADFNEAMGWNDLGGTSGTQGFWQPTDVQVAAPPTEMGWDSWGDGVGAGLPRDSQRLDGGGEQTNVEVGLPPLPPALDFWWNQLGTGLPGGSLTLDGNGSGQPSMDAWASVWNFDR